MFRAFLIYLFSCYILKYISHSVDIRNVIKHSRGLGNVFYLPLNKEQDSYLFTMNYINTDL